MIYLELRVRPIKSLYEEPPNNAAHVTSENSGIGSLMKVVLKQRKTSSGLDNGGIEGWTEEWS